MRNLIVASLVLVTILALMIAPAAIGSGAENSKEVMSKLRALHNEILELPDHAFGKPCHASIYRGVLAKKIEVVIGMVEVGAYQGAINKLEKDVKKCIEHWLTEKYAMGLIKKIDEIINLLKKLKPPYYPPISDFALTAFPKSLSVEQGGSNSSTIIVISLNGFNKSVDLTAVTLPQVPGVVLTLNPSSVIPPKNDYATSTLTVEASKEAKVGTYTINVTGTSGSLKHSVEISLKILPAPPLPPIFDFSISAYPTSLNVQQGGSNESIVIINSLTDASQAVSLAVTPSTISGLSITLNPSQVIPPPTSFAISLLTVKANAAAPLGSYTIKVTGTSGTLQHSVNITLKVTAPSVPPIPDFLIAAFPASLSIQAGDSDTSTIVIMSVRGFNKPVNLTAKSEPSGGITLSINPSKVTPPPDNLTTSTLTVKVDSTATLGNYKITVTGKSVSLQHDVTIQLVVTGPPLPPSPDFSVTVLPTSLKVQQGGFGASSIIVTSLKGFSQSVALQAASSSGVRLSLNPTQVTPSPNGFASSTLTVSVDPTKAPGKYEIIVTGTSGNLKHDAKISLEVAAVAAEKTPPQIVSVLGLPEKPAYNDTVNVLAVVIDEGSGVKDVILSYSGGFAWTNVTMTLKDGLYRESIPAFPYSTVVEYRVYASDRAGNWATPSSLNSYTVADPYPPVIGVPSWTPKEPEANVNITIKVTVNEPAYASGVRDVIFWFMNKTLDDWKAVPMTFTEGKWTAKLSNQSDNSVYFKITAFDKAGNSAETRLYRFQAKAPSGVPLSFLLLVILILAALIGSAAYLLWRRRQRRRGAPGVPPPSPTQPPAPPAAPPVTPARKPAKVVAPVKGYGMISLIVPAHNEEGTISQRIADAYERAVSHAGPSEIIIVDDGSIDKTYEAAWSAVELNRKKWPNITAKVVKLSFPLGKEEAVRFGRNKATGEIVETLNSDPLTTPSFISHIFLSI